MDTGFDTKELGGLPDPVSSLSLPQQFLRGFYLENEGAEALEEGTATAAALRRHRGRSLVHNEWVLEEWDHPARYRPFSLGLFFVSDERLLFETPADARAFFPTSIETLRMDMLSSYRGLEPLSAAPVLGDEGAMYRGVVIPRPGDPRMVEEGRLYIVAFRRGYLVARLILIGDSALSDDQVFDMSLTAAARVDDVLQNRGSDDACVGHVNG